MVDFGVILVPVNSTKLLPTLFFTAIIFVIDSSDKLRIAVAREELSLLLDQIKLTRSRSQSNKSGKSPKNFTILFLANKMDKTGAATAVECADLMELNELMDGDFEWRIDGTDCLNGNGVDEAINWLGMSIKRSLNTKI